MKVKLLRIGFLPLSIIMTMILEGLGSLVIRYIHFFSSIMWWRGIVFFMFVIIFPANKDSRYSILFPRVQRFMIIIASVALASGIVLTLVNTKFSMETLFGSSWGYAMLTGATISVFVYTYILMQNRISRTTTAATTTITAALSSSLLIPSTSIPPRKNIVKILSLIRIVKKENIKTIHPMATLHFAYNYCAIDGLCFTWVFLIYIIKPTIEASTVICIRCVKPSLLNLKS
jgi:hypothetical protein